MCMWAKKKKKRMNVTGDKHNQLILLEKDLSVTF